jgi:mediator of RNA polymerase II transcription subunit 5
MLTMADLVDVLLLPSLVPAILYLSNQLWVAGAQIQSTIIKILQVILRPSSISTEASTMLSSVLNIVAKPLEHALRSYQRQDPKSQEIEPLLRAIKENLALSRRTGGADHTELETWCSTNVNNGSTATAPGTTPQHSGLSAAVRHTVQSLIQWAQNPPLNGMPATYTHRQTLAAAKMLGADRILSLLLDELKSASTQAQQQQQTAPVTPTAYDVVTAMICAPDVTNDASLNPQPPTTTTTTSQGGEEPAAAQQRRISLREALNACAEDWKKTRKTDPALAETVVRLYRRGDAQLAMPPPAGDAADAVAAAAAAAAAAVMLQPEMGVMGGDGGLGLGDAISAAAAAAVAGGEHHEGMVLDSGDQHGGDFGGVGEVGGGEMGGDGLFGGLGEFPGWDMELGS